ncbi:MULTISPECIES: hypothetical protein [unclassified Marinovum]
MFIEFGISPLNILITTGIFSAAAAIIAALILSILDKSISHFVYFLFSALALATVGSYVGTIAGLSRDSVAGDVLPAILIFVAGGTGYIFMQDVRRGVIASVLVVAFSATTSTFYLEAAHARTTANRALEEMRVHREKCLNFRLSEHFYSLEIDQMRQLTIQCSKYIRITRF